MKSIKHITSIFVGLLLALFSISCSDRSLDSIVNSDIPVMSGGIVDLGIVNGDVHQMSVSLSGVEITQADKAAAIPPVTCSVHMEIYTNTDGILNDGIYRFSDSGDNAPFTFQSGALYFTPVAGNFNAYLVSGGTVTVTRTGISYTIALAVTATSGDSFTGHFTGNLSYMDTVVPY